MIFFSLSRTFKTYLFSTNVKHGLDEWALIKKNTYHFKTHLKMKKKFESFKYKQEE
jgi:hypothetical protein